MAAGLGFDLPSRLLPKDLGISFTTAAGYSWFGNQSPRLGGFPLPAYLNWQAGVTFTHKVFNLDLRYYGTNLSKENCFVFTGDPNARPGGRVDLVTNPAGLVSNWCGATIRCQGLVRIQLAGSFLGVSTESYLKRTGGCHGCEAKAHLPSSGPVALILSAMPHAAI